MVGDWAGSGIHRLTSPQHACSTDFLLKIKIQSGHSLLREAIRTSKNKESHYFKVVSLKIQLRQPRKVVKGFEMGSGMAERLVLPAGLALPFV